VVGKSCSELEVRLYSRQIKVIFFVLQKEFDIMANLKKLSVVTAGPFQLMNKQNTPVWRLTVVPFDLACLLEV
jgi:hypothetical protein